MRRKAQGLVWWEAYEKAKAAIWMIGLLIVGGFSSICTVAF